MRNQRLVAGRIHQPAFVVGIAKCERRAAHDRAVPSALATQLAMRAQSRQRHGVAFFPCSECKLGDVADILGLGLEPGDIARCHIVNRKRSPRDDAIGQRPRHGRVVGGFAGLELQPATAHHFAQTAAVVLRDLKAALKFHRPAQSIANRQTNQTAAKICLC